MAQYKKIKLILLSMLCVFLLSYFTFLYWQYLAVSAEKTLVDYTLFYKTLHQKNEFYKIYSAAASYQLSKNDHGQLQMTVFSQRHAVNLNTPGMTLLTKGLVNISQSLQINVLAWILASLCCACIACFIVIRWFHSSLLLRYGFFPIVLLLWISYPASYNLNIGEVGFFLLPLLAAGFVLYEAKHDTYAAIILALLASLKLFFLLFVLLFLTRKQWRTTAIFVLSFAGFFLLPLCFFPFAAYHAFFELMRNQTILMANAVLPINGSMTAIVASLSHLMTRPLSNLQITTAVSTLTLYIVIRWMMYDIRFLQKLPAYSDALRLSFLIVIALLCSPLGWIYYFIFLFVPVIVLIKINRRYHLPVSFFIALILALLLTLPTLNFNGSLFLSLLLWLFCLHCAAHAVKNNIMHSNQVELSTIILVMILLFYITTGLILSAHSIFPDFLNWDKQPLINQTQPVIWLN
jgi:hypothetical protein